MNIVIKKLLLSVLVLNCHLLFSTIQGEVSVLKQQIQISRLSPPPQGFVPRLEDLTGDGKPNAIFSMTIDSIPVLWIDDDFNMKWTDTEGDIINDCLLIDRNRDGIYGGQGDLILDYVDSNNDGKADLQIIIEYSRERNPDAVWPNGHVMIVFDTDKDQIFNYVDWRDFRIKSWDKSGPSDFFTDYSGHTAFTKIHVSTYDMKDLRLNWENPFLFYDPDNDGLSEIAIRLLDQPNNNTNLEKHWNTYDNMQLLGKINWVSISVDLDNDNNPGREFDFDFTLGLRGLRNGGFDYMDQVHKIKNLRGLPKADKFFMDPRWRQLTELIYPDHDSALDLIFKRGVWESAHFVFDEDDDCHRWERVEFYDPLDPFKVGAQKGGIDNHTQSDASGDRGEWDMDLSGGGKLYIGNFDGRLHLYGAEWGAWRIDQFAKYYQGWDRLWLNKDPEIFATVRYEDTDNNGFFDQIEYDMDGDKQYETVIRLKDLDIDDTAKLIDVSEFSYKDYQKLMDKMADDMWKRGQEMKKVTQQEGIITTWFAYWDNALSIREKYHKGFWLQYYLHQELLRKYSKEKNSDMLYKINKAYYSGNWKNWRK